MHLYFPDYAGQGYEIAGFVWFQGWNDHLNLDYIKQYENNLVNLIKDVRVDWRVPHLPVVVGEFGIRGRNPSAEGAALRKAQAAAVRRPEFAGTVALVETSAYWDEQAQALLSKGFDGFKGKWKDEELKKQFDRMGSQSEFLYMGSGKIMALTGYGMGEAMKQLCTVPAPTQSP
jgi:alpha-galactosidase